MKVVDSISCCHCGKDVPGHISFADLMREKKCCASPNVSEFYGGGEMEIHCKGCGSMAVSGASFYNWTRGEIEMYVECDVCKKEREDEDGRRNESDDDGFSDPFGWLRSK